MQLVFGSIKSMVVFFGALGIFEKEVNATIGYHARPLTTR